MAFETYHTAVDYLVEDLWKRLPVVPPSRALQDRIRPLLAELGSPHLAFPVIHVGGTTGKGSTATMAAAILQAAGYRTGLYVSPFLQTFIERTSVNGVLIGPDEFAAAVEAMKPIVRRMHIEAIDGKGWGRPTLLEVVFAIALQHFAREKVDIAVIEVGLGGRTDSTNVFDPSVVSVITNVQLDHTEVLGHSEQAIAQEKGAIIKPGTHVVTGARSRALQVIEEHCLALEVPVWRGTQELRRRRTTDCSLALTTPTGRHIVPVPGLRGKHQHANALMAVGAVDALQQQTADFKVSDDAISRGIAEACLPGRLEVVQRDPTVVLDGAHNPAAAAVLRTALADGTAGEYERLVLVIGILADKDRALILRRLAPLADHLILTSPPLAERAGDPAEMLVDARSSVRESVEVELIRTPEEAMERALSIANDNDLICVTGSIYLIGRLRNTWFPEAQLLGDRRVTYLDAP